MSPLAWARRTISCAARTWSGSVVRMKRSGEMPRASSASLNSDDLLVDELARRPALVDRGLGDVDRMLVGAGQEPRVVALHPMPARDDVGADHLVQGVHAGLRVRVGDGRGQVVAGAVGHGSAMVAAAPLGPTSARLAAMAPAAPDRDGRASPPQWRKWRIPVISIVPSTPIDGRDRPPRRASSHRAGRTRGRRPRGTPRPRRRTGRTHRWRRPPRPSTPAPSIACALATAWRAASTRDVWPLPIPTSRRSRTSTIAFDVTPRTSRQARSRSSCSSSVGARRVAHVHVVVASAMTSGAVTSTAPPAVRIDPVGEAAASPAHPRRAASSTSTRRFGFEARTSSASGA